MAGTVTKGIISNGLANIVQKIIRILDQLLLVPFFLTSWGATYYGEWLTLSIIPSILAFADFGFGSAVCNSFVLAYASGDKEKAANLNISGLFVITISVLLGAIMTVCILLLGDGLHLFEKSHIPVNDATLAVTFMMSARLLSFYTQLSEGYFRSARKAAIGSLIGSGQYLINILTGFTILMCGYGIVGYALSQFIVSVIFNISYYIIGKRLIDLKGYKGKIEKKDLKNITTKGIGYLMTPVWQSIYFQGGTFVVRLTLGPESVAIFNTVRTVCRSVNQLYSIINASIFPELQYEYGRGNMPLVHRLFRISILISMFIGFLGVIFLALFGLDIYNWWTQSVLIVPKDVWYLFVLGIFFNAIWWTSVVTYRVTNQPYHFAIMSTMVACLSVGTSYLLSQYYGLLGAVIGAILYDFIMMLYVIPDSCRLLGIKPKNLFLNTFNDVKFLKDKFR